ncbi:tyrosine-type recombinase/integrase [Methylomonas methanica]|uniref:tyrosine-type recombinase/integrase n=1 Tax=Methylomonas methanica TaxID=421 RepID=UPI00059BADB1|nr:tyrosine-type recombinase/integrase [Methylomonas methanica]
MRQATFLWKNERGIYFFRARIPKQFSAAIKIGEIVFYDSRTEQSWKNDQVIRKTVWMPALLKTGQEYRNPCQTRHTFTSSLLSRGDNPMFVAQQMGHKDWGMIRKVYGRWIPQGGSDPSPVGPA